MTRKTLSLNSMQKSEREKHKPGVETKNTLDPPGCFITVKRHKKTYAKR